MAKSLRSKQMRRWRHLKRIHLSKIIEKPRLQTLSQNIKATVLGLEHRIPQPKNAFLYPNDPSSVIPQITPPRIIDLRSSAIPTAGLQWSGGGRKQRINLNAISTGMAVQDDIEKIIHATNQKFEQLNIIQEQKKAIRPKVRKSKLRKSMVF